MEILRFLVEDIGKDIHTDIWRYLQGHREGHPHRQLKVFTRTQGRTSTQTVEGIYKDTGKDIHTDSWRYLQGHREGHPYRQLKVFTRTQGRTPTQTFEGIYTDMQTEEDKEMKKLLEENLFSDILEASRPHVDMHKTDTTLWQDSYESDNTNIVVIPVYTIVWMSFACLYKTIQW